MCKQVMLCLNNNFVHPGLDYLILQRKWVSPLVPTEFKQSPEFQTETQSKGAPCTLVIGIQLQACQ